MLRVTPNLPRDWPGYRARWQLERSSLIILVERTGEHSHTLDGRAVEGVPLDKLTGEHTLRVTLP